MRFSHGFSHSHLRADQGTLDEIRKAVKEDRLTHEHAAILANHMMAGRTPQVLAMVLSFKDKDFSKVAHRVNRRIDTHGGHEMAFLRRALQLGCLDPGYALEAFPVAARKGDPAMLDRMIKLARRYCMDEVGTNRQAMFNDKLVDAIDASKDAGCGAVLARCITSWPAQLENGVTRMSPGRLGNNVKAGLALNAVLGGRLPEDLRSHLDAACRGHEVWDGFFAATGHSGLKRFETAGALPLASLLSMSMRGVRKAIASV